MNMKILKNIMALCLITVMCACSHKPTAKLVGNDRDEHGCIASAGYRWSEALKDCIRLWEVGERLDNGDKNVYVVFSKDSAVAEVYLEDGRCVVCKKDKTAGTWTAKKAKTKVSGVNGNLEVNADGKIYKKAVSK